MSSMVEEKSSFGYLSTFITPSVIMFYYLRVFMKLASLSAITNDVKKSYFSQFVTDFS